MHGTFHSWAVGVAQWLRQWFGRKPKYHRPIVLEEIYSKHAALYRLHDRSIPGCVEVWKIVHRQSSADLAIILIDLAALREDLHEQRRHSKQHRLEAWQNRLAGELESAIEAQAYVDASHLWMVTWIKQESRRDKRGRLFSVPTAHLIGVWAVDLQGGPGIFAGNRHASAIARHCAKKILNWEATELNAWEDFVNAIPWLRWLEVFTQKIIFSEHVLQPIKPRYRHETPPPPSHFHQR